jgi:molybdate transport repressor ModE-like protein
MSRPIRAPELSELETLTLCAAEGSLAAAALQLGISRPAVAKRIAALEAIVGAPLLERNTRGVRLTEQGVAVVAHASRLLAERDALVEEIAALRSGGGESRISGVRDLLGRTSTPASRAAQRPEALLAETEQLFEIVFHASATAIAISDPDSGLVYEANDAFCAFLGRPRAEVLGRSASEIKAWESLESREQLMDRVRRDSVAHDVEIRARQPDGSIRAGHGTVQLVRLGGRPRLLTVIGDGGVLGGRPSDAA